MQLPETGSIWHNGKFVAWQAARTHVLTHALHYGSSVFEGIRAYDTPRGSCVVGLAEHVERLFQSCRICELPLAFAPEVIARVIRELVVKNGWKRCYIRPLVFRGYGVMGVEPSQCPVDVAIANWPLGSHFGPETLEQGITLGVSSWRRMAPDTHPALAKSSANYLNSQLVLLEARRHGYTDGLALDHDGFLSECSGANLFLVLRGVLYTPPLASSILGGITRRFILQLAREQGIEVREERLPRELLHHSDEVFICGTAAEVTPVREVDGQRVAQCRGPVTALLQREYLSIVRGESPDRHGWLTPVSSNP